MDGVSLYVGQYVDPSRSSATVHSIPIDFTIGRCIAEEDPRKCCFKCEIVWMSCSRKVASINSIINDFILLVKLINERNWHFTNFTGEPKLNFDHTSINCIYYPSTTTFQPHTYTSKYSSEHIMAY